MNLTHTTINDAVAVLAELDPAVIGRRLHDLLDLDRGHPGRPDGYPTSTPGAEPSSTISGPRDTDEATPSDRTEAAAWEDLAGAQRRDVIHRQLMNAGEHLIEAANHLRAAYNVGHRPVPALPLDKQNRPAGELNNDRRCWIMATVGHHEPAFRTTDFDGMLTDGQRLDSPRPVGRWAYDLVRRTGRLPTDSEKRAHAQGRNVRVPA